MSRTSATIWSTLLLCAAACDNIGRAFNPDVGNPGTAASSIEVVPRGGDTRTGRPTVKATYPADAGWPATVPIVVEFSESVNQSSIAPTTATGTDGHIILRIKGTTQALPCQYDFVAQGRLLVMRPLTGLTGPATASYEVVLLDGARDCDGVQFQVQTNGTVLSTFQTNQDATIHDGRILAVYPRDNARDPSRESVCVVVFDRPANGATLTTDNLFLRPQGDVAITGELQQPLTTVGVVDPRVARFTPSPALNAATRYELVVNDSITFGTDGKLDFSNRTPFSRFTTISPQAPTLVQLGNPSVGFDNKINRQNAASTVLRVTMADDAAAGDKVVARIYGGDASSAATGDMTYAERTATLSQGGAQDVDVDFSMALGSLSKPLFDDGNITFAVQTQHGSEHSGFLQSSTNPQATFDITPPRLLRAGPPSSVDGLDLLSDVEYVAFYGMASEALSGATLTAGASLSADMYASGSDGSFLIKPVPIGRNSMPTQYTLTFTDRAGNMIASPASGNIVQRGFVTGALTDTLTVEAYDSVTLLPIAGAAVLVDPATPTNPATNQLMAVTDATGRATFAGVSAVAHTITIVRSGYDLVTMYATQAAFASLPLRPQANATATFRGTATFASLTSAVTPPTGSTVITGNNTVADRSVLGVRSALATPTTIPDTSIIANRMQLITAFGGTFQPMAIPTFAYQAVQAGGLTGIVATPPVPPVAGGSVSSQALAVVETGGSTLSLLGPIPKDFSLAQGLDVANLVGSTLQARVTMSVQGFIGQGLAGIGTVTGSSGSTISFNANFSLPVVAAFRDFFPFYWVMSEARDTGGRISRHRHFLNPVTGEVDTPGLTPQSIPLITPQGTASTGSPAVTVDDVITPGVGLLAVLDVTATDPAGRNWVLIDVDRDAAGGTDTLQFPDLAANAVPGLQAGTWQLTAEARLLLTGTLATNDDLMLTERFRQEVLYSRSATVPFTIQ